MVFKYCLSKCDFFYINHILNIEKLEEIYAIFGHNHNLKTNNLWHFDFPNLKTNEIDILHNLYQCCLHKSDLLYLCIPKVIEAKDLIATIQNAGFNYKLVTRNETAYIEFTGSIKDVVKKELFSLDFFKDLNKIKQEWRFKLFNGELEYYTIIAVNEFVGITLSDTDVNRMEEKDSLIKEKLLSNVTAYGCIDEKIITYLIDMFSLSITKPFDKGLPYFTNFSMRDNNIQKLYLDLENLFICFSEGEFNEFIEQNRVDTNKWTLICEKSNYLIPDDYFKISMYDLW